MLLQRNYLIYFIPSSHSDIYDICFLKNIKNIITQQVREKKCHTFLKNIDFFSKNKVKVVLKLYLYKYLFLILPLILYI